MTNYQLAPTEVVLMESNGFIQGKKSSSNIILTNLNVVFETRIKKLFKKAYTVVEVFSLDTVKIYKDMPYIKQKNNYVQIYFTNCEPVISFNSKRIAHQFTATASEVITGKNAFFRGIEKVKKTIDTVDETLGIDTVGATSAAIQTAITPKFPGSFKKTREVFKAVKGKLFRTETQQIVAAKPDDQVETLKKWKELLDDGAITEEEYNAKKAELLNL